MRDFRVHTPTARDVGYRFLLKHEQWINSQLGCPPCDMVRLRPPDWISDFITVALKHLYFKEHPGIVSSNLNPIALSVGNDLASVEATNGLDGNLIEFYNAQKSGEWYANSSEYLLAVKIRSLSFPFLVYCQPVAMYNHTVDRTELIVPQSGLSEFVTYFQNEERRSGRITVNVFGQKTYTIKPMEWENMIMDESIDFLIKKDLETFMQKKAWFSGKGIPYRRGYLLHGPPGNGKTSAIRAMLTQAKLPAFTIKKMYDPDAMYYFDDMFDSAAKSGGAFIILEDIDRSFSDKSDGKEANSNLVPFSIFLNCLDGISDSDGVIVVATANNPQVLDKAILERPGRFDRVVHFPNPSLDLRKRYLATHLTEFNDDSLTRMANSCNNMSFAQLREIYIIGSQIAEDKGREVGEDDIIEAHTKMLSYLQKAKTKDAGYKS